jgi:LIVCS family branched-chain amino acid:cation transporter
MRHFLFVTTMGFALFAMHFGSGNLVFPLTLGREYGHDSLFALLGLITTAVGLPALGFLSMLRFQGDPKYFFGRFGKIVSTSVIALIVALMGPFGCLPRCIALTHTIVSQVTPGLSLPLFCLFSSLLIFALTVRKTKIVSLLGSFLTPLLLVTLGSVLIGGLFAERGFTPTFQDGSASFLRGVVEGYQTMDLLAALFFCPLLFKPLQTYAEKRGVSTVKVAFQTVCISSVLLMLTYAGFGLLAATHSDLLQNIAPELLLICLAKQVLGSYGAYVTPFLVAFACLTTAIALASIFADFLQRELNWSYSLSLGVTLVISYFGAVHGFTAIVSVLGPILELLYPLLTVWSLYNLLAKKEKRTYPSSLEIAHG